MYNVHTPYGPCLSHVTVRHRTLMGRVTVGETHNPNVGANIQHQLTRTVPTHAMIM